MPDWGFELGLNIASWLRQNHAVKGHTAECDTGNVWDKIRDCFWQRGSSSQISRHVACPIISKKCAKSKRNYKDKNDVIASAILQVFLTSVINSKATDLHATGNELPHSTKGASSSVATANSPFATANSQFATANTTASFEIFTSSNQLPGKEFTDGSSITICDSSIDHLPSSQTTFNDVVRNHYRNESEEQSCLKNCATDYSPYVGDSSIHSLSFNEIENRNSCNTNSGLLKSTCLCSGSCLSNNRSLVSQGESLERIDPEVRLPSDEAIEKYNDFPQFSHQYSLNNSNATTSLAIDDTKPYLQINEPNVSSKISLHKQTAKRSTAFAKPPLVRQNHLLSEIDRNFYFRSNSCLRFLFRFFLHAMLACLSITSTVQDKTAVSFIRDCGLSYSGVANILWHVGAICLMCQFVIFILSFAVYASMPSHHSPRLQLHYTWLYWLATSSAGTVLLHCICCHGSVVLTFLLVILLPGQNTKSLTETFPQQRSEARQSCELTPTLLASHESYSIALSLAVLDLLVNWFQAWVVYFWSKPCCYWAEPNIPHMERRIYSGHTGRIKRFQTLLLPILSATIFACGIYTVTTTTGSPTESIGREASSEEGGGQPHLTSLAFVVAMWLCALTTFPVTFSLVAVSLYLCLSFLRKLCQSADRAIPTNETKHQTSNV